MAALQDPPSTGRRHMPGKISAAEGMVTYVYKLIDGFTLLQL